MRQAGQAGTPASEAWHDVQEVEEHQESRFEERIRARLILLRHFSPFEFEDAQLFASLVLFMQGQYGWDDILRQYSVETLAKVLRMQADVITEKHFLSLEDNETKRQAELARAQQRLKQIRSRNESPAADLQERVNANLQTGRILDLQCWQLQMQSQLHAYVHEYGLGDDVPQEGLYWQTRQLDDDHFVTILWVNGRPVGFDQALKMPSAEDGSRQCFAMHCYMQPEAEGLRLLELFRRRTTRVVRQAYGRETSFRTRVHGVDSREMIDGLRTLGYRQQDQKDPCLLVWDALQHNASSRSKHCKINESAVTEQRLNAREQKQTELLRVNRRLALLQEVSVLAKKWLKQKRGLRSSLEYVSVQEILARAVRELTGLRRAFDALLDENMDPRIVAQLRLLEEAFSLDRPALSIDDMPPYLRFPQAEVDGLRANPISEAEVGRAWVYDRTQQGWRRRQELGGTRGPGYSHTKRPSDFRAARRAWQKGEPPEEVKALAHTHADGSWDGALYNFFDIRQAGGLIEGGYAVHLLGSTIGVWSMCVVTGAYDFEAARSTKLLLRSLLGQYDPFRKDIGVARHYPWRQVGRMQTLGYAVYFNNSFWDWTLYPPDKKDIWYKVPPAQVLHGMQGERVPWFGKKGRPPEPLIAYGAVERLARWAGLI